MDQNCRFHFQIHWEMLLDKLAEKEKNLYKLDGIQKGIKQTKVTSRKFSSYSLTFFLVKLVHRGKTQFIS